MIKTKDKLYIDIWIKVSKVNCIQGRTGMSRVVVPESQPCENSSDYDNVGASGADKIMERSLRTYKRC